MAGFCLVHAQCMIDRVKATGSSHRTFNDTLQQHKTRVEEFEDHRPLWVSFLSDCLFKAHWWKFDDLSWVYSSFPSPDLKCESNHFEVGIIQHYYVCCSGMIMCHALYLMIPASVSHLSLRCPCQKHIAGIKISKGIRWQQHCHSIRQYTIILSLFWWTETPEHSMHSN